MAYVDTPMAAQRIKDTQPQIEQNFIEINNLVSVDHYTFGSPNQGQHMKVTLPDQGLPPVFPGNDVGLWAQIPTAAIPIVPLTGVNELYIRRQDGSQTNISGASLTLANGWSYLASGLLLKWGSAQRTGPGTVIYPTAVNIPIFQSVLTTFTQPVNAVNNNDGIGAVTVIVGATYLPASFDVYCAQRNDGNVPFPVPFFYITLGT